MNSLRALNDVSPARRAVYALVVNMEAFFAAGWRKAAAALGGGTACA